MTNTKPVPVQFDVPRDIHREARMSAFRHEQSLRAWLLDAIKGKLALQKRGEWTESEKG